MNEEFTQVTLFSKGELVIRMPGTNIRMPYTQGSSYVNKPGNLAYVALDLNDIVAEDSGEAVTGVFGKLGLMLRKQLNDSEVRKKLLEVIEGSKIHLLFSQILNGKGILTLPGLNKDTVDEDVHKDLILVNYKMEGKVPNLDEVYGLHWQAVAGRKLVSDKKRLRREASGLVDKVNGVYDFSLELIKTSGF